MRLRPWILLVTAALVFLIGCDHATKYAAETSLRDRPATALVGRTVELEYHQNPGVAFNHERVIPAAARKPIIVAIGVAAMAFLAVALYRRRGKLTVEVAALLLIAGGAAGNLLDRVVRGYVVDFVHVAHWPVFNVADVWLVVGAGLMIIAAWRARTESVSG